MASQTLEEFLANYDPDGSRTTTVDMAQWPNGQSSPFIMIRAGNRVAIVNPIAFDDHLSIDIHSFTDGNDTPAGAFGMTNGQRWAFPETGETSHGWNAARLVTLLIGEYGESH